MERSKMQIDKRRSKMIRFIGLCVVVVTAQSLAWADYVGDRQAAMELVKAGKTEAALAAFVKMSQGTVTAEQKSDALTQAAESASQLKQFDRAMELARQIPIAGVSKACQMHLLTEDHRWQEIVDGFKNEEIENWPDS